MNYKYGRNLAVAGELNRSHGRCNLNKGTVKWFIDSMGFGFSAEITMRTFSFTFQRLIGLLSVLDRRSATISSRTDSVARLSTLSPYNLSPRRK